MADLEWLHVGPASCGRDVASGFANLEAALVVATLAQRFELDALPGQLSPRGLPLTGGPDGTRMISLRPRTRHIAASSTAS